MYGFPQTWQRAKEFTINGTLFTHGINASGKTAALNIAIDQGISVVSGHLHQIAGIMYKRVPGKTIFGMNVGCLTNDEGEDEYAFEYSEDIRKRPVYGCGIVISSVEAYFTPMLEE